MSKESEKKDNGKSISARLGINAKIDKAAFKDLSSNDGSEDPGSELDKVFSNNKKKIDMVTGTPQTSGTPPKGEELDAFTNNASKKAGEKHPKSQADSIMNPGLNSENDI
jgi:hypothetical protein